MRPNEWLDLEPKAKPYQPRVVTVEERLDTLTLRVDRQAALIRKLEDRLYHQARAWTEGDDD